MPNLNEILYIEYWQPFLTMIRDKNTRISERIAMFGYLGAATLQQQQQGQGNLTARVREGIG